MSLKIAHINLESGMPSSEDALRRMRAELATCRHTGVRAAILIHGYGSSGYGGAIRGAVRKALSSPEMVGMVREVCPGEQWHANKRRMLELCKSLDEHEREIDGNFGVTVVILR